MQKKLKLDRRLTYRATSISSDFILRALWLQGVKIQNTRHSLNVCSAFRYVPKLHQCCILIFLLLMVNNRTNEVTWPSYNSNCMSFVHSFNSFTFAIETHS